MLMSLSFIFLVGLAMAAICQRIRLPRIIGMLLTGIVLGPYVLDLLEPSHSFDFIGTASDGADHHFAEGGPVAESGGFKEGGTACRHAVLRTGEL